MCQTPDPTTPPINRLYKSRLFTMIFNDKKELLSLYNAVNGSHYTDPNLLTINTLDNAIYMTMKNDLSFLFDVSWVYLFEHQSTWSPNLPLRQLWYVSNLFSNITKDKNIYGTTMVKIPTPEFFVFYNGTDPQPEQQVLRLSDMFEVPQEDPQLELKLTMLNINRGCNMELMAACKTLRDYAEYTARVRTYAKEKPIAEAVEQAITECIKEDILAEFLSQNRAEAKKVSIYEYDEEKHLRMEREDSYNKGFSEGHESGFSEGHESGFCEGHESGKTDGIELTLTVLRLNTAGKSGQEISDQLNIPIELVNTILKG